MFWKVPLICLQSVVEELLCSSVYVWFKRASFFVDFKRRWMRLENFLENEAWEFFRELPYLKNLFWIKFVSPRISLFSFLGWSFLFIEICRGSQVFFQCYMTWFYWLIFINEIFYLWQDIFNILSQVSTFY